MSRGLIMVGPVGAALATSAVVARVLVPPPGFGWTVLWWLGVLGASTIVLFGADRLFRRLTPMAALLKLTMVFPDRAPSRFRVARQAGRVRELQERVEQARAGDTEDDASDAAATILALVAALSAHDMRTRGHSERTSIYADLLAEEMEIPSEARERLRWAALLHDVGKLAVSPEMLNKRGAPEADEWDRIRRHPEEGARLVAPLLPWLGEWGRAISEHHERYDGQGYPEGLKGEQISLGARIVSVADAYETITAGRPYRRPLPPQAAREEIATGARSLYDPKVCRALMSLSLGHLRRRAGVFVWIAQLPFTLGLDRLGQATANAVHAVGSVAAAGLGAAALVVTGILPGPGPSAAASPSPDRVAAASPLPASRGDEQQLSTPTPAPDPMSPPLREARSAPLPTVAPAPASAISCNAGDTVLGASQDSWVRQGSDDIHADDPDLSVQSKFRPDLPAKSIQDRRAFLSFDLPTAPEGCRLTGASLRLHADESQGSRVIEAWRVVGDWVDTALTWSNQPATGGSPARSPSGLGWRTWDVTSLVTAMYVQGSAGFLIKDQAEGGTGFAQRYVSSEGPANHPSLILSWGAA